jgi:hypothetical protein
VKHSPLRADPEKVRAFQGRGRRSSAKSLRGGSLFSRTDGPKPNAPPRRRDWAAARAKCDDEGRCRISDECKGHIEAAHVIGREHDRRVHLPGRREAWWFEVDADSIVPMCRDHHQAYDDHELDLLPYLTPDEQVRAVADAGGIELARIRTCPSAYAGGA